MIFVIIRSCAIRSTYCTSPTLVGWHIVLPHIYACTPRTVCTCCLSVVLTVAHYAARPLSFRSALFFLPFSEAFFVGNPLFTLSYAPSSLYFFFYFLFSKDLPQPTAVPASILITPYVDLKKKEQRK